MMVLVVVENVEKEKRILVGVKALGLEMLKVPWKGRTSDPGMEEGYCQEVLLLSRVNARSWGWNAETASLVEKGPLSTPKEITA